MKDGALLVFHSGALGDLVATFANLLRLKQRFSGGIDGVCQDHLGYLARKLGIFRRGFGVEAARFASLYADTPQPSDRSMEAFFHPYRAVVLFSNSRILEKGVSRVFQGPVYRISPRPPVPDRIHVQDYVFQCLVTAGLLEAADGCLPFPCGFPPLKQLSSPIGREMTILIHPGSGSPRKNWPSSHFAALAQRLRREGMSPEFVLGPAEHHLMKEIRNSGGLWSVHTPSTMDALLKVLNRGDGYVGNDSGVSHLAAFLGLPTLAVFGPSDPVRWRPWGRSVAVLAASGLHCAPCFEHNEKKCDDTPCLANITVEKAAARFFDLLSGGRQAIIRKNGTRALR